MNLENMIDLLERAEVEFNRDLYVRATYSDGEYQGACLSTEWTISRKYQDKEENLIREPEPEFDSLDKALAILAPSITYLHYKEICRELIKLETYDGSDYYNTIESGIKYIKLQELHEFLETRGYI